MRTDNIELEEKRLENVFEIGDYHALHERHRIFPEVFAGRRIEKALDIASGVGVVGKRIKENCSVQLLNNDICPKCLQTMQSIGLQTVSFDIDDNEKNFPFDDGCFDAVIALATIEHLINTDHFIKEIHRIVRNNGYLFISAPNYSGLPYLLPFLMSGRTFHDPMSEPSRYEFFAHVRYFTYLTMLEYISSFGFVADTVYLPLPESGSRYLSLVRKSKMKAIMIRSLMKIIYRLSPRWASEPVFCFQKTLSGARLRLRKVIL
jgi:SAM-dependent methyltransferase